MTQKEKQNKSLIENEIYSKAEKIAECLLKKQYIKIYPAKDGIKVTVNHESVLK